MCVIQHTSLTKFHLDNTWDSKEISIRKTSIMKQCLWWRHRFFQWISQKHKSRYLENETFFHQIKNSLIKHQGLAYCKENIFLVEVNFKIREDYFHQELSYNMVWSSRRCRTVYNCFQTINRTSGLIFDSSDIKDFQIFQQKGSIT